MDLIIQPALEYFHFDVIRADLIPRASVITNDIIQLIQESQLCIADISDRNPNVFYEVGRRHETGKPLVQVIADGQDIPFDLSGIRTLEYSLESPRQVKVVIEKIREFIKFFEDSGYSQPASGASLASIAGSLDRVERQLSKIAIGNLPLQGVNSAMEGSTAEDPLLALMAGPQAQIRSMIAAGRIDEAAAVLMRNRELLSRETYQRYACMLTMGGVTAASALTQELLDGYVTTGAISETDIQSTLGALVQYYGIRDREQEGIEKLASVFTALLNITNGQPKSRAIVYNQMGKLYSGAGDLDSALLYTQKAADADPEEPTYKKNNEFVKEMMKQKEEGK